MNWIERTDWFNPNLPSGSIVEIKGHSGQTKIGRVLDFCWNRDPDGEGTITHYRVLSKFNSGIKDIQTISVAARVPEDSTLLQFENKNVAGLFMVWWEKTGNKEFFQWHKQLEEN